MALPSLWTSSFLMRTSSTPSIRHIRSRSGISCWFSLSRTICTMQKMRDFISFLTRRKVRMLFADLVKIGALAILLVGLPRGAVEGEDDVVEPRLR